MLQKWLRWLLKPRRSPYPKGFILRGIAIFFLTVIPIILWVRSIQVQPENRYRPEQKSCPPHQPYSPKQVLRHPERYIQRQIWIFGRIYPSKKQCIHLKCSKQKPCCSPCQASARLVQPQRSRWLKEYIPKVKESITLQGLIQDQRISCLGDNCSLQCKPFKIHSLYAFAGRLQVLPKSLIQKNNPQQALATFWVTHYCPLSRIPKTESFLFRDPVRK